MNDIRKAAEELVGKGFAVVRIRDKRPYKTAWTIAPNNPEDFLPDDQIGIIAGPLSGFLMVVDIDLNDEAYRKHTFQIHSILPSTDMVDGRHGKECLHYYYRIANPFRTWNDIDLPGSSSLIRQAMDSGTMPRFCGTKHFKDSNGNGIDFIGAGGQVVCPPSLHHSGVRRKWTRQNELLQQIPAIIEYEVLEKSVQQLAKYLGMPIKIYEPLASDETFVPTINTPREEKLWRATAYAKKIDPSIQGQRGNAKLINACHKILGDFDLSVEDALIILKKYWNPRCLPPWSDEELIRALRSVERLYEET